MVLACVVLHNLCIAKGDFIPRKFDLTFDHMTKNIETEQNSETFYSWQIQIDQIMKILE